MTEDSLFGYYLYVVLARERIGTASLFRNDRDPVQQVKKNRNKKLKEYIKNHYEKSTTNCIQEDERHNIPEIQNKDHILGTKHPTPSIDLSTRNTSVVILFLHLFVELNMHQRYLNIEYVLNLKRDWSINDIIVWENGSELLNQIFLAYWC